MRCIVVYRLTAVTKPIPDESAGGQGRAEMHAKAAVSLCTGCLSKRKGRAAHTADELPGCLQTGKMHGKPSARKTKGVCGNVGCAARGQRTLVRGAATQTGKMSNKRKELLTAALWALCRRAGEGRGKRNRKPAETFCFNGFGRSINLLGRLQTFGWFVGNGYDRSVRSDG